MEYDPTANISPDSSNIYDPVSASVVQKPMADRQSIGNLLSKGWKDSLINLMANNEDMMGQELNKIIKSTRASGKYSDYDIMMSIGESGKWGKFSNAAKKIASTGNYTPTDYVETILNSYPIDYNSNAERDYYENINGYLISQSLKDAAQEKPDFDRKKAVDWISSQEQFGYHGQKLKEMVDAKGLEEGIRMYTERYTPKEEAELTTGDKALLSMGTFLFDLPAYIGLGTIFGATTRNPAHAIGAPLAIVGATKHLLREKIRSGDMVGLEEIVQRGSEAATEAIKEYAVGRMSGEVGNVLRGMASTGKFPSLGKPILMGLEQRGVEIRKEMVTQMTKTGKAAVLGAETVGFGTVGPVIHEKRAPNYEDILLAAVPILGIEGANRFAKWGLRKVRGENYTLADLTKKLQEIEQQQSAEKPKEGHAVDREWESPFPERYVATDAAGEPVGKLGKRPRPVPEVYVDTTGREVGPEVIDPRTGERKGLRTIDDITGVLYKEKALSPDEERFYGIKKFISDNYLPVLPILSMAGGFDIEDGKLTWNKERAAAFGAGGLSMITGKKMVFPKSVMKYRNGEWIHKDLDTALNIAESKGITKLTRENREIVEKIKWSTGWFPNEAGQWMYEVSDHLSKLKTDTNAMKKMIKEINGIKFPKSVTLAEVIDHPVLFERYPQLKTLPVLINPAFYGAAGYDPTARHIALNPWRMDKVGFNAHGTILHEVQHSIQHIEGFPSGGSRSIGLAALCRDDNFLKVKDFIQSNIFNYRQMKLDALAKVSEEQLATLEELGKVRDKYKTAHDDFINLDRKATRMSERMDAISNRRNKIASNYEKTGKYLLKQHERLVNQGKTGKFVEELAKYGTDKVQRALDMMNKTKEIQDRHWKKLFPVLKERNKAEGLMDEVAEQFMHVRDRDGKLVFDQYGEPKGTSLSFLAYRLIDGERLAFLTESRRMMTEPQRRKESIVGSSAHDLFYGIGDSLMYWDSSRPEVKKDIISSYHNKEIPFTPEERALLEAVKRGEKPSQTGENVRILYGAMEKMSAQKHKEGHRGISEALRRDWWSNKWVDVSGQAKDALLAKGGEAGRWAKIHKNLIAGAPAKAGKIIEDAQEKIFDGLSKDETRHLNRIITSNRTIDIDDTYTGFKFSGDLGARAHQEFLSNLKNEIGDAKFAMLAERAERYHEVFRQQLGEMRDAGLITQSLYEKLAPHKYSPRRLLEYIDPETEGLTPLTGIKVSVRESGLQWLKDGDFGALEMDASKLLAQVVSRTQSRIFKNRANQSLARTARETPDNGIVMELFPGQKPKKGWSKLHYFDQGIVKEIAMPKKFADEWVTSDPEVTAQWGYWLSVFSGQKFLKAAATGYNPAFVLTNVPRDVGLVWASTSEYSSFLPKMLLQYTADVGRIISDASIRRGRYNDYINQGGGMEFLTHYGRFGGRKELATLSKWLGYIGETSEVMTRLALRERAINNRIKKLGREPTAEERLQIETEATEIARNYLDFSQGGGISKAIDKAVPYFNASVQAGRGLFRAAKTNSALATWKMMQVATLSSMLYLYNRSQNPDAYNDISDFDKANNWIITTGQEFIDDKGEKRNTFIKIAKDQGMQSIASTVEAIFTRIHEGKVPTDQLISAWGNLVQTQVLPPTLAFIYSYATNKDFWTWEDAWKGDPNVTAPQEVRDKFPWTNRQSQYSKYTHPFAVQMGELTGLSPDRLAAAGGRIIPPSNFYISAGLGVHKLITGRLKEEYGGAGWLQMATSVPAVRRVFSSTHPYTGRKETAVEHKQNVATKHHDQNLKLDMMADRYFKTEDESVMEQIDDYLDVIEEASSSGPYDRKRLEERFSTHQELYGLKNRTWWVNLKLLGEPEEKAEMFWKEFEKASPEEQDEMIETVNSIKGIRSKRFLDRLSELEE